jgi:hypothetical protein
MTRLPGWFVAPALLTGLACGDSPSEPDPTPGEIPLVATVEVPANYGLHDTFVRDGVAYLSVWNTGVWILDVGGGGRGGSPAAPVSISTFVPSNGSLTSPAIHNAWLFDNPVSGERRYLFLGQEGPASIGASASGDLKVLDLSDPASPAEVGFYRVAEAGAHNFWMDEPGQVLYAAFYNGGVAALDVSGPLAGDLAGREIARVRPGGDGTYVWGVMLSGGHLYAIDMGSGLWQLDPATLQPIGGGNNVPERFSSDLWIHEDHAYTGTWGNRGGRPGNAVKIWQLGSNGAPTLVDSIIVNGIGTVSDIQVSDNGRLLVFSAEGPANAGLYVYRRTDPLKPTRVGFYPVEQGIHTVTVARVGDKLYAFGARNPVSPALLIFDLSAYDREEAP